MLVQGPIELGVLFGKRTSPHVMLVFGVPRDLPPLGLSFKPIVVDDSAYVIGSFDAYVDTRRDYATWFAESSAGPIIGDVLMSGGRVLGGIVHAQVASRAE